MYIIDNTHLPQSRTTTLNLIPVGQVFRGEITGPVSGRKFVGVFWKTFGRWTAGTETFDVIIHILIGAEHLGTAPIITKCAEVWNYEPLTSILTLGSEK